MRMNLSVEFCFLVNNGLISFSTCHDGLIKMDWIILNSKQKLYIFKFLSFSVYLSCSHYVKSVEADSGER